LKRAGGSRHRTLEVEDFTDTDVLENALLNFGATTYTAAQR
jgi:hypothetical protein